METPGTGLTPNSLKDEGLSQARRFHRLPGHGPCAASQASSCPSYLRFPGLVALRRPQGGRGTRPWTRPSPSPGRSNGSWRSEGSRGPLNWRGGEGHASLAERRARDYEEGGEEGGRDYEYERPEQIEQCRTRRGLNQGQIFHSEHDVDAPAQVRKISFEEAARAERRPLAHPQGRRACLRFAWWIAACSSRRTTGSSFGEPLFRDGALRRCLEAVLKGNGISEVSVADFEELIGDLKASRKQDRRRPSSTTTSGTGRPRARASSGP